LALSRHKIQLACEIVVSPALKKCEITQHVFVMKLLPYRAKKAYIQEVTQKWVVEHLALRE
jgi:hypothetical protein